MERAKTPAEVYEELFVPAMFRPCARELLDVVPPRPGDRVLDVACGTGGGRHDLQELAQPFLNVAGASL